MKVTSQWSDFSLRFHGEGNEAILAEVEGKDGMGEELSAKGVLKVVEGLEIGKVDGAGLPLLGHFSVGGVVEVAEVVDRDGVAFDLGPPGAGPLRLPVAVVGWLDGAPGNNDGCHRRHSV